MRFIFVLKRLFTVGKLNLKQGNKRMLAKLHHVFEFYLTKNKLNINRSLSGFFKVLINQI